MAGVGAIGLQSRDMAADSRVRVRLMRKAYPALIGDVRQVEVNLELECLSVDPRVAVTNDALVDLAGGHKYEWVGGGSESGFEFGCVQESEGEIERFSETAVLVVVDLSGVDNSTKPERLVGMAMVVGGQPGAEMGDDGVEDECLGHMVDGMEQSQYAVAPVDVRVVILVSDARDPQGLLQQVVHGAAELGLLGVGATGGTLDVDPDDGAVVRVLARSSVHDSPDGDRDT